MSTGREVLVSAVLLAEHATWSGSPRHLLLALQWCREQLNSPLSPPSASSSSTAGSGLAVSGAGGRGSVGGKPWQAAEVGDVIGASRGGDEAESLLMMARVIARADEPLPQPRARF